MTELNKLLLERLENGSSHRALKPIVNYGTRFLEMEWDGQVRRVLNFASNDYLGLSEKNSPFDFHSQPSSRLLSGNLKSLEELELKLANFMSKKSAILLNSGYTANLGMLSSLANKGDLILADHAIHASLIDGMRLSSASWKRFKHNDIDDLERLLRKYHHEYSYIWVVVEGLFSMDGDIFPLESLVDLKKKYSFFVLLDEAHSFGVYGDQGKGLAHYFKVIEDIDVIMFNLSKALAMQGGVIVGPSNLKPYLVNRCRPLIYSTATPLSHLEILPERLSNLEQAKDNRTCLQDLCQHAQTLFGIKSSHWSPILPVATGHHEITQNLAAHLLQCGIFCPAILPPTVPEHQARLRVSLTALHQKSDIELLFHETQNFYKANP